MSLVLVPPARIVRWCTNFEDRHGPTEMRVEAGGLVGEASDGSRFAAHLPFQISYAGGVDVTAFAQAAPDAVPGDWGVLLVRKGGFAIARVRAGEVAESKVGQRHVQGRTKAGGQSQQRFARRRDNQARQAFEAAADHAIRILGEQPLIVVTGGDRTAVESVLEEPRLRRLSVVPPWLDVPDPRRAILNEAIADAQSVQVEVHNA